MAGFVRKGLLWIESGTMQSGAEVRCPNETPDGLVFPEPSRIPNTAAILSQLFFILAKFASIGGGGITD